MPRQSRASVLCNGAIVHVICRFVDYRFLLDDEGRRYYLGLLARALRFTDWSLVSYALMSSHIHLALLMGSDTLKAWVHRMNGCFAQWVNDRLRRTGQRALGPVFAGRPTTRVMSPERTRLLITYQHRNPLEAGVVADVRDSDWTSHRAYLGLAEPLGGLDVALGLRLSGYETSASARAELHAFVARTSVSEAELVDTDVDVDVDMNVEVATPERHATPEPIPALRGHDIVRMTCAVSAQPIGEVVGSSRRRSVVAARRAALVAWLELGGSMADMARALHITPSAASRLLSRPHDAKVIRRMVHQVLQEAGTRG